MKVLVTGGFGNIGTAVIDECLTRGYSVSVFDIHSKKTEKRAHAYGSTITKVYWGDIRKLDDCRAAVEKQDVVIHMAAIIPPVSDRKPELTREVNIRGTQNIVDAITESGSQTAIVLASSASVMGATQNGTPPVRLSDPVQPTDVYSTTKVEAEELVRESKLRYCILRLAAVMLTRGSYSMKELDVMFDIPLDARCETVIDLDVAYAMAEAAYKLAHTGEIDNRTFFLGGGEEKGCQMQVREMIEGMITPLGLKLPPRECFSRDINSYYLDWYDTKEAQEKLRFQNHSFGDFKKMISKKFGLLKPLIRLASSVVNRVLANRSPYGKHNP